MMLVIGMLLIAVIGYVMALVAVYMVVHESEDEDEQEDRYWEHDMSL
jgi:uncharacterized membrane protein